MTIRKWGTERLVNTSKTGNQHLSKIAALPGGGFVVVWQDNGGAFAGVRGQVFDAQGNRLGGEIAIDVPPGNDEIDPSVTATADSGFYVTWTQLTGNVNYILGSIYSANGTFVRNQPAVFSFSKVDSPEVTRIGTGTDVVWHNPDPFGGTLEMRLFDGSGGGPAQIFNVNSSRPADQANPAIAVSPDQSTILIAWEEEASIQAQEFDVNGNPASLVFRIDDAIGGFLAADAHIVWLNNDTFAATWVDTFSKQGDDVEMRVFSSSLAPVTDIITVNAARGGNQNNPSITPLSNGEFVVSWTDNSGIGVDGDFAIRLQAFDTDGVRIGGQITVNTTTKNAQTEASIAALPDGRVVVSWTDASGTGGDTSGTGIRMQIVDPRDGIVTGTPGSETLYGHDLVNDEISAGDGSDKLFGMRGDDALYGGDGNDVLNGGPGVDLLYGGAGNDTYYVDDIDDVVTENLTEGSDTVFAAISYTLETGSSIEFLRVYAGATPLTLTGNNLANTIAGGTGNDSLSGGGANDTLNGGTGADTLTGGTGSDIFRIVALTDSTVAAAGQDKIADFSSAQKDKIDLHLLDANTGVANDQAFSFIGSNAFSGTAGELRYAASAGNTLISGDVNGDKLADFSILATGAHTFSGTDFTL